MANQHSEAYQFFPDLSRSNGVHFDITFTENNEFFINIYTPGERQMEHILLKDRMDVVTFIKMRSTNIKNATIHFDEKSEDRMNEFYYLVHNIKFYG